MIYLSTKVFVGIILVQNYNERQSGWMRLKKGERNLLLSFFADPFQD